MRENMVSSWYIYKVWLLDYHDMRVNMVSSWYSYKVRGGDCHENSTKWLSHGMKKRRFSDIAMRKKERRGYHGKDSKVIFEEYHEMMVWTFLSW
ncbi:MAG: hypothetical protein IJZ55_13780 [Lachnospiraceae bacterium]|nr:hypothetical protein [Lachnospiraceae bacterium]